MKITFTIRNIVTGDEIDIMAEDVQRIQTTVNVLRENLPKILKGLKEPLQVQSDRTKRYMNLEKTYRDMKIYNGDILLFGNVTEEGRIDDDGIEK